LLLRDENALPLGTGRVQDSQPPADALKLPAPAGGTSASASSCGILREMSHENVEVVRKALALFSVGDFEGTLEFIDEDAVWEPSGQFVGAGGEYRGHQGIRRFWEAFTEPWEEIRLDPAEVQELDANHVLTVTHFRGIGRTSGAATEMRLFHMWTLKGRKISRFQSFASRGEALEAAGMSEQDVHPA
jgi:ketosteroid isomerase-like protein